MCIRDGAYSFATLRQFGAAFECAATYLKWLSEQGVERLEEATSAFTELSTGGKTLQFQLARGDFGDNFERVDALARKQLAGGVLSSQPGNYLRSTPSGRVLQVATRHLPDGGLVRTYADVTEQQRVHEELRASELRYRTLLDATSAVTWTSPPDGRHVEPQPSWMAFTGQTAGEMLGDGWMRHSGSATRRTSSCRRSRARPRPRGSAATARNLSSTAIPRPIAT